MWNLVWEKKYALTSTTFFGVGTAANEKDIIIEQKQMIEQQAVQNTYLDRQIDRQVDRQIDTLSSRKLLEGGHSATSFR